MPLPTVTQTWTFSLNNRYVYPGAGTLVTTMGAFMFSLLGVGGFLTTTMGYTVKGSSNGTTGAMDGVNRITSAGAWGTRGTSGSSAMSWIVLTDGAGIDWCFAYHSFQDDVVRLSHSTGGNYVAAGTPTFQPTATDECFDSDSGSWINGTTSADRVWQMMASSDKKMFRFAIYRQNVLAAYMSGEKLTSALAAPATFTLAVGGGTVGAIKTFITGASRGSWIAFYGATTTGAVSRTHAGGADVNGLDVYAGELFLSASNNFSIERPALQGELGELIFPAQLYSQSAGADGKLGTVIDLWYAITNSATVPNVADVYGNLQLMSLTGGGPIVPLDGATVPVTA